MMNKVLLMILDGWGKGDHTKSDAIYNGHAEYLSALEQQYPSAQLLTCGENVGLPDGQMGNSEVGHLNLGAGRVVYQDLVKINKAVKDGSIASNPAIKEAFTYARENGKAVHFIGLLSDGGVHSLDKHVYKLCDVTKDFGVKDVFVHAFTDGRDTDPKSGKGYVEALLNHLKTSNGKLASVVGRYYAMDRDKRWERVKEAYDLLVYGKGKHTSNALAAMQESYDNGVTDEFIKPIVCVDENDNPVGVIKEGDVVFNINFRSDRAREITMVLVEQDMPEAGMKTIPGLRYLTMTPYDDAFKNVEVVYGKDNILNTLGEVVSKQGLKQLHIAETEKYAHVTFFFNGGREEPYEGEKRILIPSPKVATYDLKPEMSAYEVKDAIVEELKKGEASFICLNFANGDMVGHTGVYEAIIKAVKAVDECAKAVVETAKANGYTVLVTADHGNADYAINSDGTPNTAHSLNPVPFIVVSDTVKSVQNGVLADVAPTVLKLMGIEQPADMTGHSLV
ncbi:MAG TPA: 2,3-bisphosphoglycerate-independent phosphoglycerate mutase [Candidatus Avirikenella pullistercoris]|nr:2,3-bisphosphoglycerate-independent phosphoglycerate mutase [Candidatus Avirikenella pullistercoris]